MTRKDYVAIAKAIAQVNGTTFEGSPEWQAVQDVATRIANVMAMDNERFDRVKFAQACGY